MGHAGFSPAVFYSKCIFSKTVHIALALSLTGKYPQVFAALKVTIKSAKLAACATVLRKRFSGPVAGFSGTEASRHVFLTVIKKSVQMKRLLSSVLAAFGMMAAQQASGQTDTMATNSYPETTTLNNVQANAARPPAGEVYRIRPKFDIPFTVAATAYTLYGFTRVYGKDNTPEQTIRNLDVQDIPRFDRWAADIYNEKAATTSDYLFYGSVPIPFLLLADREIRKDAAKIGLLYLQAMSSTGVLYTSSNMIFNRFRPYAYNPEASLGDRREGNARNSFFAGHAALVGTATFFTAKVYADYHPESSFKYVLYGAAALATGATGYLRHRGGRHFPSDILVGTAVGTLSGILVPHWHKHKPFNNEQISLTPFTTGTNHGMLLTYRFK